MKTPKSLQRQRDRVLSRWSEEDYPGGSPRFQLSLLARDIAVFCLIPLTAVILYKLVENSVSTPRHTQERRLVGVPMNRNDKQSQIIRFGGPHGSGTGGSFSKRAPGTLVRVRLMNVVETYANASVHAQILDASLGKEFMGGTLVGDATPDSSSGRININFHFARHPTRLDLAVPLCARAMSLDGTSGVEAQKKEGFFARVAIRSAATNGNTVDTGTGTNNQDFKTLIARAVAAGMMQEFQSDATVAHNQAQVLTLQPLTEFYVELTDYFPGQMK